VNELAPVGLGWFTVDDTGGGDVVTDVVVVVVVVGAGSLWLHAAVNAPIATIARAPA
jgi:hypothetical protein